MVDAARAALLLSRAPVDPTVAKSHGGLRTGFLQKNRQGKFLNAYLTAIRNRNS